MNPQDPQYSSPTPDYSFITNQPGPPAPKMFDKRIIVLVGLIAVTILVLIIGSLAGKKKSSPDSAQLVLVKQYMKAVKASDATTVLGLYAKKANRDSEFVRNAIIKPLQDRYDISSCSFRDDNITDEKTVTMVCPLKGIAKKSVFQFSFTTQNNIQKIDDSKIVGVI